VARDSAQREGEELLRLAMSRPAEALARADALASATDPVLRSYAHQAAAIVVRDAGRPDEALPRLRVALRAALRSGRADRSADVRATLGAALVMAGRTAAGLRELDRAARESHGALNAKVRMRRAHVLTFVGRHEEAMADLQAALTVFRRSGDIVWAARTLNNRASVEIALGLTEQAQRDVGRAEALFTEAGQDLEAAHTVHNRGVISLLRGDLPGAFARLDEAGARYAGLGVDPSDLVIDRCTTALAAGLTTEAVQLATEALAGESVAARHRAELQLMLGSALLAQGQHVEAREAAIAARRLLVSQQRDRWADRASLVLAHARWAEGERSEDLLSELARLAERFDATPSDEAALAHLLAGRLAAARGDGAAREHLMAAARLRRHRAASVRVQAWLATAHLRSLDGGRGVLRACGQGLDAVAAYQRTLGSAELRALVTVHGQELAALALEHALSNRGPRSMLQWSERGRATALLLPRVQPPTDPQLAANVAALRAVSRRLAAAQSAGVPAGHLAEERAQLEQAIRRRDRHLAGRAAHPGRPGGAPDRAGGCDIDELGGALGAATLVELVEVAGQLHGLVLRRGRVRRVAIGPAEEARLADELARFTLRQAARGRPTGLRAAGERLQRAALGPVAGLLDGGRVILSPPPRLHAAPWALAPALADVPFTTVPSASVWLRAHRAPAPRARRMVLIGGPGLSTGGAEVPLLAGEDPTAVTLAGDRATVEGSLAALDGAALAHVAAHGHFRADNPMFSGLELVDGTLTALDLGRLAAPPHRLVLSACDSGLLAPAGAAEVLGLAAALLSLGTASVVAAVGAVDDAATVALMLALHGALRLGRDPGRALMEARRAAAGEHLAQATAASFVAVGV